MKSKIFTLLVLGMMLFVTPLCNSQNILTNGDFSNPASIAIFDFTQKPLNTWCTFVNNFTTEVSGGVCKYDIIDGGTNTYDIQLIQWGFPLKLGKHYRLSFEVRADADRDFGVYIGQDEGSWMNLNPNYTQHATANWETKTIEFDAIMVFDLHKLSFEMGKSNIDIYFRNIMLQDIPNVWLTGSAFGGWVESGVIKLSTTDGVTYTATNIELLGDGGSSSEFKFTEGTWPTAAGPLGGPPGWPSGIASVTDGGSPNMLGEPGFWNLTYNYLTKAYSFTPGINPNRAVSFEGTSLPSGVGLSTTDSVNYSKESLTISAGNGQFVEKPSAGNSSPTANWSSVDFPIGIGTQDGALIPAAAGTYNVSFNISTGAYNFQPIIVSIIGDFSGWGGDFFMTSTDNIIWTLSGIVFYSGGNLKFRDNLNWNYNFGSATGTEFPTGTAISSSSQNIPYEAGTYDITFNRTTLEYTFTAICIPTIKCPWDVYVNTDKGKCGAIVNYPEVVADVTCGDEGITIKQTAGLPSGSFFPIGYTWNAFELTNSEGKTATCGFYVYVSDPPKIKSIPDLWPPNHKMVPIHLDFENNCVGNVTLLYYYIYNITSNEPDNGLGDGDVANDWQIDMYGQNLLLRAERSGKGKGRVYSFNIWGYDESYNTIEQIVTVRVPHDKGEKAITAIVPPKNYKSAIIEDESAQFSTKVWPNSSRNSFNLEVQSNSNEKIVLSVFDGNGRLISNQNVSSKQITSFGEDFSAGIYMVLVRQGNDFKSTKVVKQ